MKAFNGFLMIQRQMTLKGECGYSVRTLHWPHMLDAFLAYTYCRYHEMYVCRKLFMLAIDEE